MSIFLIAIGALLALGALGRLRALSANTDIPHYIAEETKSFPVAAGEHIYRGAYVGTDPAGNLKAFVPGDVFRGIAYEEADNSDGSAAAINCRVYVTGDFDVTLTSGAKTDTGKPLYATADNTTSLTGHPDAYMGRILNYITTNTVQIRLKTPGEKAPNGRGSVELVITGMESVDPTGTDGATHGNIYLGGFEGKSILGAGISGNDAEDGGVKLAFDAVAEIALASIRTINDCLPVDKGITFEVDLVASDSGDNAALDIDFGFGTALTTNSEADADHADMAQLACFHVDGASDNILAQSDDATTDVAATDTTVDNDSATDVSKKFKIVVRPTGAVEFWIAGARVLSTTTFALLSTAVVGAFVNMEKTSNDTTAELIFRNLRVAGAAAA